MWNSPGFSKLTSNYTDLTVESRRQRAVVRVHRREDPGHRQKSRDGREADSQGPSLRREAASLRHRLLRGLQQPERLTRRSQADADRACHRERDRDDRRCTGVRHHRVGDGLRLRHRRAGTPGDPWSGRSGPRGLLGGRSEDLPRRPERRLPEPLLPRWATCRSRQQPAVQRRPGGLHHRHTRLPARPRLRHHRGGPGGRRAVDEDGRYRSGAVPLRGEQLLLRKQHPREASPVPPELGRSTEALQGDPEESSRTTTRRSDSRDRPTRRKPPREGPPSPCLVTRQRVRRWRPASTASPRCRAAAAGAR